MNLKKLQTLLGYEFKKIELLERALTHRGYNHNRNNERLEFIGDAILDSVIGIFLYRKFDKLDEGDLTRLRAKLVREETLFEVAQKLDLSHQIRLGECELKSAGFRRPSILADALEAIFGAVYLDSNYECAEAVVIRVYGDLLEQIQPKEFTKDPKSALQEYTQGLKIGLPEYQIVQTYGEAHKQTFVVECVIADLKIRTKGVASSRRTAEQESAKQALEIIEKQQVESAPRTLKSELKKLNISS